MDFVRHTAMLTRRNLVTLFRTPAAVLPSLLISAFFLLVYQSSLSKISVLPAFAGQSYLGFILPVSIVSASLGGAGLAGQALVRDLESGYFSKLLLTPVSRGALLLAAILSGALILGLQAVVIMAIGLLMGLDPATGVSGVVALVVMAVLLGTGFAGYTVAVALRTGSAEATQGASFAFFPLTFITSTFVPEELLSGWIKVLTPFNPITYVLQAMRATLNTGWDGAVLLRGLAAAVGLGLVTYIFAVASLRARTRAS
ncbi:MAG TPA: ABC transporter permease [Symbiobacteriaceae bacterium]|jgi:ABC-2 type transport system permease protein|nr:ABC transporter permease [Symbiobacteriaceae bacterium]